MARITADDHGAKVILAAGLMLSYTIILVVIRLHTRWPWTQRYRKEDTVLLLGTVVSICYTATLAVAVENGYGLRQTISNTASIDIPAIERRLGASIVLFYLTEGLGTLSYGMFLVSMAADDSVHRLSLKVGCYATVVYTGAAVIVSAVYAARRESLTLPIWIAFGVIHSFILLFLFGSIASMLAMGRMPWWKRARATLWFALALALIAIIVVRLIYTPPNLFQPGFTLSTVDLIITMTIELHFHLFNGAYPNLLVFVERSTTGWINGVPRSTRTTVYMAPDSCGSSSRDTQQRSFSLNTHKFSSGGTSPNASAFRTISNDVETVREESDHENDYLDVE